MKRSAGAGRRLLQKSSRPLPSLRISARGNQVDGRPVDSSGDHRSMVMSAQWAGPAAPLSAGATSLEAT
jgi:hypothetical protein